MVLSNDKLVRTAAQVKHLEMHGTLWIMDRLVEELLLHPSVAADRLEALVRRTGREQRYLPRAECEIRIRKWRRD
jgi:hypothetical protein